MRSSGLWSALLLFSTFPPAFAAPPASPPDSFDHQLEAEVEKIEKAQGKASPETKESWQAGQKESRRQLAEMLGLDPMPPRGDLHTTRTGEFEHEGIIVENLHYQSLPGLYVTANLYRPKDASTKYPAVLYLSGHSNKIKDGISYGNKTGYEHHGVWYAKHGFICLMIDTVQLGEIRGTHHGTHTENRWDWISRGYTPAGVEAWAGIRGIDYLESRTEVDPTKIGVTGRSGGGAYSWWVAALDERVTCAAPTAGITSLRDHVVHKCVYGHCDCMFMVNTYRWDYDRVASLVAPRPLLIANTDKDPIFPIDGVFDVFRRTRKIYQMLGADKNLGLQVAEGGHTDVQPLNTGEFHWMLRHLKGEPVMATYDGAAVKSIPMEKLRVFDKLPDDQRNTTIDRSFIATAEMPTASTWNATRLSLMKTLDEKVFASWPKGVSPVLDDGKGSATAGGLTARKLALHPQGKGTDPALDLFIIAPEGVKEPGQIELRLLDSNGWNGFQNQYRPIFPTIFPGDGKPPASSPSGMGAGQEGTALVYFCPRGEGPYVKTGNAKDAIQLRRSFYLTGSTLESWQVWDIRAAVNRLRSLPEFQNSRIKIIADGPQAVNAIYASLHEPGIAELALGKVPLSHADGDSPSYLNVLKYMDIPQAAAMAASRSKVTISGDPDAWKTALDLYRSEPKADSTDRGLSVVPVADDKGGGKDP